MVVLAAGGCGGDDPAPEPLTTTLPPPASASAVPVTPEGSGPALRDTREFVTAVRDGLDDVAAGRTDDELGLLGGLLCDRLAAGDTADAVVARARSLDTADAEAIDHATARELIKLAIDTVCLDQAGRVDEF